MSFRDYYSWIHVKAQPLNHFGNLEQEHWIRNLHDLSSSSSLRIVSSKHCLQHRPTPLIEISFLHLHPPAWTTKDMIPLLSQWRSLQFWAQATETYSFLLGNHTVVEWIWSKCTFLILIIYSLSGMLCFLYFLAYSIKSLPRPNLKVSDFQKCMKISIQTP